MRTTRVERKAAAEAKHAAALAEFYRLHRCCECGAPANIIVVSGVRAAGKTKAFSRNYCEQHAPSFFAPSSS